MTKSGTLYLLPVTLGPSELEAVLPSRNITIIRSLIYFISENAKDARAFLKLCAYPEIAKAQLSELNQHAQKEDILSFLKPLLDGYDLGLMSDAGCPGIADPGAEVVKAAHEKGIKVVPLVGPSSIVLSIMASGFNGQNFAFNGYLPIDKSEKTRRIKDLELLCIKQKQAQFFIETPYRNVQVFDDLLKTLHANTKLLVATHITLSDECIQVKSISDWKKNLPPNFTKKPTVFGIYVQ